MRAWRKQEPLDATIVQDVARAAISGASRAELAKVALSYLLARSEADRIGVWVETRETTVSRSHGPAGFRGVTADRDGAETPSEWDRISPEAPLPADVLTSGQSVEQDLDDSPDRPILGALVGMQRALWVPVENKGRLRGVLLAAMRRKNNAEPRRQLEQVADELALALEWEDEQRRARERTEDLAAMRKLLEALASCGPVDEVLEKAVASCIESSPEGDGIGAVFAVLRGCDGEWRETVAEGSAPVWRMWRCGDEAWLRAMESEPLAAIFRRAHEAHGTIASVPSARWSNNEVARIIAIPLEAGGKTLGVLAAGFRKGGASVAASERLELRASLATAALHLRNCNRERVHLAAQQEALLLAGSGATILTDADGQIAGISREARELLRDVVGEVRMATADTTSLQFAQLFRGSDQQSVADWIQQATGAIGGRIVNDVVPEAELYNGVRVRLRCGVPDGGGLAAISLQPIAARGTVQHTVRAEHAEAQLLNVIEWLEEGVVLFDADHGIRTMNTRFAQITGLTPEDTRRITTFNSLIARLASQTAQPEHFAERWREQVSGGDASAREEIQLLAPVPRVIERVARPIADAAGRRIGRVEIYRDLTAQRVFQSKLIQTEKLAALGQMVTGVAHELSNPLTSILGYAQRQLIAGDAVRPAEVQQIFQEAERASTIVRQLLMTARDSRPERRRVALNEVISRALGLQRFSLVAENVRVEQDLDPNLPFVLGDAGQLQQVLMNLIGNSRQAVEQGGQGGTVKLRTKRTAEGRALLEVSDDGPGIPDAILPRIFDPFFTTKPAGIGTGLGLAIVLGIVREHGGQVHVVSPPGGGATFALEFPAARDEESRVPALPATGPGIAPREIGHGYQGPISGPVVSPVVAPIPALAVLATQGAASNLARPLASMAGSRVLVVEDEPTVARLIGDVLKDEGLRVDVLLDGREALERAAREAYDLVICDMKMPHLDGQHFYRSLVSSGNPLRKKFLFVTGDVIAAHTHEFLERYHLPHVEKPFRVEELSEKVRRVLAGTSPSEPLPAKMEMTNAARK